MDLPGTTIEHLRDEAYAMLSRRAILLSLDHLEKKKAHLATTRPPFGFLAPKPAREAFNHSMRVATGTEAALRTQLGQIIRLEHLLQGRLHPELRAYLSAASPDFQNFNAARDLVDQWQLQFRTLPDLLTAFARDVRHAAQESGTTTGARDLQPFAVLRDSALHIERDLDALDAYSTKIASYLPPEAANEARMPALPQFRRVAWVNQLAALPPEALQPHAQRVESEARQFVAHGDSRIPARLDAMRETCSRHEELFLQHYWNTLRAHAQAHYVEERDIADILADLTQRYVTSDLDRRQRDLGTADPFQGER
jgi:hypothetical protein